VSSPRGTATCRLCGGTATKRFRARDLNLRLSDQSFSYWLCADCKTLQMVDIPTDLGEYYPSTYYVLPGSRDELAADSRGEQFKLDIVQRHARRGRLLEIGPAVGGFALLAQDAGFDVDTVEMDARCCEFLRDVVGVRATQSTDPAAFIKESGPFDVITLWHVLEHLPDPRGTLQAAAEGLAEGGILVIAVPNPQALQFRLFRTVWAHLDAPRHLQLMPARSLRRLVDGWGLKPAMETSVDTGGLGWNAFGWQMSIRNLGRVLGLQSVPFLVGRMMGRLLRPLERKGMRGSTYTLILRKDAAG
jgi:SAM-dependent methyltransferase